MKEKIAKTMMELMKVHHYSDITIQMICDATPVSRNSFYYHFKSKQDLLEWICIWNYQTYCLPDHYDEGETKTLLQYIYRFQDFYREIYNTDGGILLQHCLKEAHISGTSKEKVKEYTTLQQGPWRKINKNVYLNYATSGIAAVLTYWVATDFSIPIDDIAKDLAIMLTKPLTEVRDRYVY